MTELESRLRRCFETVFPAVPVEEIGTLSAETLDAWDSVATVTLISVIEEEFDISFPDEAIERALSYDAVREQVREATAAR
jgi:acyl carrier protein